MGIQTILIIMQQNTFLLTFPSGSLTSSLNESLRYISVSPFKTFFSQKNFKTRWENFILNQFTATYAQWTFEIILFKWGILYNQSIASTLSTKSQRIQSKIKSKAACIPRIFHGISSKGHNFAYRTLIKSVRMRGKG